MFLALITRAHLSVSRFNSAASSCELDETGSAPVETPHDVIVINDAGPAPELNAMIRALAGRGLFHLEQHFTVTLKPRSIERLARDRLGGAPLEVDGAYSLQALQAIHALMPEVPAAEMSGTVRPADLPRRFRVRTFMELVRRAHAGEIPHG